MDWNALIPSLPMAVIAALALILNRRDRLADKVDDLAERVSRIEGILLERGNTG